MNIKPFNFDEFVKVAYGEKGLSIWNDYYSGMTGEKLAEKYGMRYTKMQTLLINLRSHVRFWDYAFSYKDKDWAQGILIILTVYSAYLVDDDSPNRIRAINAVLKKCHTVEEFLNMSDDDILKLRNVGKKTASYLSKIRENMNRLIRSRKGTYMDDNDMFNLFKERFPSVKVTDYQPLSAKMEGKRGIVIYAENGDIIAYFPKED